MRVFRHPHPKKKLQGGCPGARTSFGLGPSASPLGTWVAKTKRAAEHGLLFVQRLRGKKFHGGCL